MRVPWIYIHTVKEHIRLTNYQLLRTLKTRLYSKCNLPLTIGFLPNTPLPAPSAAQSFAFLLPASNTKSGVIISMTGKRNKREGCNKRGNKKERKDWGKGGVCKSFKRKNYTRNTGERAWNDIIFIIIGNVFFISITPI